MQVNRNRDRFLIGIGQALLATNLFALKQAGTQKPDAQPGIVQAYLPTSRKLTSPAWVQPIVNTDNKKC